MDFEQYKAELRQLRKKASLKEKELMKKYVAANNPIKIGDKFTDHIGTILVEKIGIGVSGFSKPCAIYYGSEFKKDGTPKKNGAKRQAWQSHKI